MKRGVLGWLVGIFLLVGLVLLISIHFRHAFQVLNALTDCRSHLMRVDESEKRD